MMFRRVFQVGIAAAVALLASSGFAEVAAQAAKTAQTAKTAQASKTRTPQGVVDLKPIIIQVRPNKPLASVDIQRARMKLRQSKMQSFVHRIYLHRF